jgi:hypothetical protein
MTGFIGFFLIQCATTLSSSLLHTRTHTHTATHTHQSPQSSLHCRCLVAASTADVPLPLFPNCPRPQLPASQCNNSQRLNRTISRTHRSLGTQRTENICPLLQCNCCLVIAWCIPLLRTQPSAHRRRKHHSSVVVYGPVPSNGRLLWLYNYYSEWIC